MLYLQDAATLPFCCDDKLSKSVWGEEASPQVNWFQKYIFTTYLNLSLASHRNRDPEETIAAVASLWFRM